MGQWEEDTGRKIAEEDTGLEGRKAGKSTGLLGEKLASGWSSEPSTF